MKIDDFCEKIKESGLKENRILGTRTFSWYEPAEDISQLGHTNEIFIGFKKSFFSKKYGLLIKFRLNDVMEMRGIQTRDLEAMEKKLTTIYSNVKTNITKVME